MKSVEEFFRELFKAGTPQGGFFYALGFLALAFMFLFLGFFKTLFVAALFFLGMFLGGVKNKPATLKNWINKIFPPRQNG